MSVLERYPSYKESNKGNKQKQGKTLGERGVRLIDVTVKRVDCIKQTPSIKLACVAGVSIKRTLGKVPKVSAKFAKLKCRQNFM